MWLLDKAKERAKDRAESWQRAVDSLKEFRGRGEPFNYCGVTMYVEAHTKFNGSLDFPDIDPCITAVYKNAHGELKREYFWPKDLETLKAQNQEA